MKTEYLIVSMKLGEISHEELGPLTDKDQALDILETFTGDKYHFAYLAFRDISEWVKVGD